MCIRDRTQKKAFDDLIELRAALLDFIADFANWDSSTVREFLDTSRTLTQSAHEALGGARAPARSLWTRFAAAARFRWKRNGSDWRLMPAI